MTIHNLKIDVAPFNDLLSGAKTGEVRNDDRGFEIGDTVHLTCTDGRKSSRTISHIQRGYGLPDGLCVLSYTRATPSADTLAGLVRYRLVYDKYVDEYQIVEHPEGAYVLHSEAAKIIADISERLKNTEAAMDAVIDERIEETIRADAAEAELAKLKAQEPVAWMYVNEDGECEQIEYDRNISEEDYLDPSITLLYAAPVSDSLKAENERLREALEFYADGINNRIARAALNVEASNDKG